jgi:TolB-like protein/Tfp pilus assembly protein PilF
MGQSDHNSDRNISKTLVVYLGGAWLFIEILSFLTDKYNWNTHVRDAVILLVIFGLPALAIYEWFYQRFTKTAIFLQLLNLLLAFSVIGFDFINPDKINPSQLRLLKFKVNQKKLTEAIQSIAILPFYNYTGDESQAYLIAGMHDALISELGQIGAIRVISKTSSLRYKNSQKIIKEIANELNVDAIIEASVLSVDENIKIQFKLINVFPEEQQLWAETFDSSMSNILDLYNRVIKNVASEIQLTLSPGQQTKLATTRQVNPDSYKDYLRGMYNLNLMTAEGTKKGLEYLHEAIRIDPAEPFAYAGLALGYLEIAHGPFDTGDALLKAEIAANKAIQLDTTVAEVYSALGELNLYSYWKFNKAEKYFKKAIDINPNLDIAHYHYAWALYLLGRIKEAIDHHKISQKLDPLNPLYTAWLGELYNMDGSYEDGLKEAFNSIEIQKDFPPGYFVMGESYLGMGREDDAIEAHKKLVEIDPSWNWELGRTYALTNQRDKAEKILKEMESLENSGWKAVGLSIMYGELGYMDEAFKWLNYEPHHGWITWAPVAPWWKPLRDDARFKDFEERLNLP